MLAAMTCAVPHPIRARDGLTFVPDLEVIGSHATETWLRCRHCGIWFWASTDVGGKYEYVGAVAIDPFLGELAFVERDLDAIAELVATKQVPYGPIWTTASALVEVVRALTPGSDDAARAGALRRTPSARWAGAAELLAKDVRAAPAPALQFSIDLQLPGYAFTEYHEVGPALVLVPEGRTELLRLEARGLVQLPVAARPRYLASHRDAVMFAIATPAGDAALVLDAAGNATASPPAPERYEVTALDDGWWLFVPHGDLADRHIELHVPDGTPRVKLPRRFTHHPTAMPPPRRFADGWIVSNLVDDDGNVQALTLFDAQWQTAANSIGIAGDRAVTPIDDTTFWASTDDTIERWIRREQALERVESFAMRASWIAGDRLIVEGSAGELAAYGRSGEPLWTWQRATTGATYGVATPNGVLVYDDVRAHLLDRDGRAITSFAVEHPDVLTGTGGTVYVKSTAELWIVRDEASAIVVGTALALETTCGDAALLARADGYCELVSRDGSRASFTATGATFSVIGTLGGPYVVEAARIRAARLGRDPTD